MSRAYHRSSRTPEGSAWQEAYLHALEQGHSRKEARALACAHLETFRTAQKDAFWERARSREVRATKTTEHRSTKNARATRSSQEVEVFLRNVLGGRLTLDALARHYAEEWNE